MGHSYRRVTAMALDSAIRLVLSTKWVEATTGIESVDAVLQIVRGVLNNAGLSTNPSANVPQCPPIFTV